MGERSFVKGNKKEYATCTGGYDSDWYAGGYVPYFYSGRILGFFRDAQAVFL